MGRRSKMGVRRIAVVLALVAALGTGSYLFTASNTFSSGTNAAGEGSGTVSGYTVGAPAYTLLSSDPSKISSFQFSISGGVTASTVVKASLVSGSWVNCSVGSISAGAGTATCSYSSGSEPSVVSVTNLDVVAAN
jgi:hypothetical protein